MQIIEPGWVASSFVVVGRFGSGMRQRAGTALVALGCALAGCAASPPTAEVSDSIVDVPIATSASRATASCAPGAMRECKTFWHDKDGRVHCDVLAQVCRADGVAWQPCGELDAGSAARASDEVDPGSEDAGIAPENGGAP